MGGSFARKMRRSQERKMAKRTDFTNAVKGLGGLRPAIDDTQTAVMQVLTELDQVDLEIRRQRAVFLRMVMEMRMGKKSFLVDGLAKLPKDHIQDVLDQEEQYRIEYDVIFAISRGLMLRQQAEEPEEQAQVEGTAEVA